MESEFKTLWKTKQNDTSIYLHLYGIKFDRFQVENRQKSIWNWQSNDTTVKTI